LIHVFRDTYIANYCNWLQLHDIDNSKTPRQKRLEIFLHTQTPQTGGRCNPERFSLCKLAGPITRYPFRWFPFLLVSEVAENVLLQGPSCTALCIVSRVRLRVSHGDVNLRVTADFCMLLLVKSHLYPNVSSKLQSSTGTALYIHLRTLRQSALSIVHQNTDNTMANTGNNIEVDNDMVCLRNKEASLRS
jgi:hypothetical protein